PVTVIEKSHDVGGPPSLVWSARLQYLAWLVKTRRAFPLRTMSMLSVTPPGCRWPPILIRVPPWKFFMRPSDPPLAGILMSLPIRSGGWPCPADSSPHGSSDAHSCTGQLHLPLPP